MVAVGLSSTAVTELPLAVAGVTTGTVPVVGVAAMDPEPSGVEPGPSAVAGTPCGGMDVLTTVWVTLAVGGGGCSGWTEAPTGKDPVRDESPKLEALDSGEDRLLAEKGDGFSLSPTSRKNRLVSITVSPRK